MQLPTPDEVTEFERIMKERFSNKTEEIGNLFEEYRKASTGPNIYQADDFTWRASKLSKGGLLPKGQIRIVVTLKTKERKLTVGCVILEESTFEQRRIIAYRIREKIRQDEGI